MLNENNKIEKFVAAIDREASLFYERAVKEADQKARRELFEAKKAAAKKKTELTESGKRQILEQHGGRNSERLLALRKARFEERERIRNEIFAAARARLVEFTLGDGYPERLKNSARRIGELFGGAPARIGVRPEDMRFADLISEGYGARCEITPDGGIELGGVWAVCEEKKLRADDTLDTALKMQDEWFCENSGI